jgi:hypothetical protein
VLLKFGALLVWLVYSPQFSFQRWIKSPSLIPKFQKHSSLGENLKRQNMGNIDSKDIEKFEEKMKFQKEKESDWIKTCVTSTSTILGILIALTDGKGETIATKYFFVFTILSLGLCTLFGLLYIQMYGDTAQRLVVDYLERTNNLSRKPPYLTAISPRKIFSTYERLFYYSSNIFIYICDLLWNINKNRFCRII